MRLIGLIVAAELRQHLRDPLTIAAMVGVPLLVYPLLGIAGGKVAADMAKSGDEQVLDVGVIGTVDGLTLPENVRLVPGEDAETMVTTGVVKAAAKVDANGAEIWYSGKEKPGRDAADRLERALGDAARQRAPRQVISQDLLSPQQAVREQASRVVPALLLFTMLTGGLYTALDLVTGEKERGTIETTLTTAASRQAIVIAKYLCVFLFSVVGVLCSVASGYATARWVSGIEIPFSTVLLGTLLMLPACGIVSAVLVAAAAWVPDFKAGQVFTMPLLLVPLVLGGVAAVPGVALTPATALFPIANLALSLRELVAGRAPIVPLIITFVTTTGLAFGAIRWATAQLGREDVILGSRGPGQRRLRGDYRADAWVLYTVGFAGLWLVAMPLQAMDLRWGMFATQLGMILPLAMAAPAFVGLPLREVLRLNVPRWTAWIEAVVLGCFTPLLGFAALWIQGFVLPEPGDELTNALLDAGPIWVAIPLFAVLPGLCEEMFFRGAFFGLYRTHSSALAALIVSSIVFGIFHVEVYRMFPTAMIGFALGALSLRHKSVLPGMLAHAVNNAVALVGISFP